MCQSVAARQTTMENGENGDRLTRSPPNVWARRNAAYILRVIGGDLASKRGLVTQTYADFMHIFAVLYYIFAARRNGICRRIRVGRAETLLEPAK